MKKQKPVKTEEARRREAEMIREQLEHFGFPEETLREPLAALARFAAEGQSFTHVFKMRELGCSVLLQLSMQPHVVSFARVRRE